MTIILTDRRSFLIGAGTLIAATASKKLIVPTIKKLILPNPVLTLEIYGDTEPVPAIQDIPGSVFWHFIPPADGEYTFLRYDDGKEMSRIHRVFAASFSHPAEFLLRAAIRSGRKGHYIELDQISGERKIQRFG